VSVPVATSVTGTAEADVETPTLRRTARRAAPWIVLAALVVIVVVALLVVSLGGRTSRDVLAADNPGPEGARALVQVLRQHGVDVRATSSLAATDRAVHDPTDTTVVVFDPDELLSPDQHDRLRGMTDDLVLVAPAFATLGDLAPGVAVAGRTTATLSADCDVAAVRKAGTVSGAAILYDASGADDATSCLRHGGGAALVQLQDGGERTTILGAAAALENGTITQDGDAALALNLLGAHHHLVWYLPSAADLQDGDSPRSLADVTPPWVTPFALLLLAGVVAAAFWRGRRMGRVVVENLPVEVRARETMEGRARLYERAGARTHALDAIRIGTASRLARMLGMPRTTSLDEIADAVAAALGRPAPEIAGLLRDTVPGSDADLIALSDALARLEQDTARAVRP